MLNFVASVDVRIQAPKDKHPAILKIFKDLALDEKMELINDYDPRPLNVVNLTK